MCIAQKSLTAPLIFRTRDYVHFSIQALVWTHGALSPWNKGGGGGDISCTYVPLNVHPQPWRAFFFKETIKIYPTDPMSCLNEKKKERKKKKEGEIVINSLGYYLPGYFSHSPRARAVRAGRERAWRRSGAASVFFFLCCCCNRFSAATSS